MRTLVGAVVAASLVLAGCADETPDTGFSGLPSETPSASASPVEPSPSASAEAQIDVTTTPDEITPEWVTAVVNTLLAEYGEMTAEILATPVTDDPTLPEGFEERLEELFAGERLQVSRTELEALRVNLDERRDTYLPAADYGGLLFTTLEVQYSQPGCIIAVGTVSRELSAASPGASGLSAASLVPSSTGPTAWRLLDLMPNTDADGTPLPNSTMLGADLELYGNALSHECEEPG